MGGRGKCGQRSEVFVKIQKNVLGSGRGMLGGGGVTEYCEQRIEDC